MLNKGQPDENEVISGVVEVKGDDGYKYFIRYTIDKNGSQVEVDRAPIRRIPPNALKSLVGWELVRMLSENECNLNKICIYLQNKRRNMKWREQRYNTHKKKPESSQFR